MRVHAGAFAGTSAAVAAAPARAAGRRLGGVLLWVLTGAGPSPGCRAEPEVDPASTGDATGPEARTEPSGAPDGSREPIVIAVRRLPQTLDPIGELEPWALRLAEDLVFEALVRRDPTGAPWAAPQLADECRVESEGLVVHCHLRPEARFHDGTAVAADDVVYSLGAWLDPRRAWLREQEGLGALEKVEVGPGPADRPDPGRWIRLGFAIRDPLVLERLARAFVVPRASHRGGPGRFGRAPIGSGPMRVAAWDEARIDLVALDPDDVRGMVSLRRVDDGAVALSLLRRHEVHYVDDLAPAHVPVELARAGMDERFVAWVASPPRYDLVVYNLRRPPLGGLGVRRSLDAVLPRALIASKLHGFPGAPVTAPVDLHEPTQVDLAALGAAGPAAALGMAGLPEAIDAGADVEGRANADAGLSALGFRRERGLLRRGEVTLRVPLWWDPGAPLAAGVAAAIRSAWQSLGIQAPAATASFSYLVVPLRRGEYDAALVRWSGPSDADLWAAFASRGGRNLSGIADAELDRALLAYRGATDRAGRDAAKRAVAARLAALLPVSVVHAPLRVALASRRLEGLVFLDDLPRLRGLRLVAAPR